MSRASKPIISAKTDGLYYGDERILSFVPRIEEITDIITATDDITTSYQISILKDETLVDSVIVNDLYINKWFKLSRHCPSASLTEKHKQAIEQYLEEQAANMTVSREWQIPFYGWHFFENGIIYFNQAIFSFNYTDIIVCTRPNVNIIDVSEYHPNLQTPQTILQAISTCSPGTSWIIYMISYLDILKELFKEAGYPIHFITNLYGRSGTGKTTLVKTLCAPSYNVSFRSVTRRDKILRELTDYSGCNVLVDDFHPAESKSDKDRQNSLKDSLVRLIEESENAPNVFITSEYLAGHFSLQDRELQFSLEKPIDFEAIGTLVQYNDRLEKIRTAFCAQVVKNVDAIIDDIRVFCAESDKQLYSDSNLHFRNDRYTRYIICINSIFKKYFLDTYNISFSPPDLEEELLVHSNRQATLLKRNRYLENLETILIVFWEMLDSGVLLLEKDWYSYLPSDNNFCVRGDGQLCISYNAIAYGMRTYLKTNKAITDKIIQELKTANLLSTYETDKGYTKKHHNIHYYSIDWKRLKEYCQIFE